MSTSPNTWQADWSNVHLLNFTKAIFVLRIALARALRESPVTKLSRRSRTDVFFWLIRSAHCSSLGWITTSNQCTN